MRNLIITVLFFAGCYFAYSYFDNSYSLTNQKKIDKGLLEEFSKTIGEDAVVYYLKLEPDANEFTYKVKSGTVYYSEPGSDEVKGGRIWFSEKDMDKRLKEHNNRTYSNRTPDTGIPLSQLDLSRIADNIAQGVEMLSHNDIKAAGVEGYEIHIVSSDPSEVHHFFTLSEKAEKETVGNRVNQHYYTYDFRCSSDGWLTYVDDDEEE